MKGEGRGTDAGWGVAVAGQDQSWTATPPILPVIDNQSFTHRPSLLAGAFEGNAVFRKFWWFQNWMATHSRKGANLRHRRGGALLPNTREQGGESLPSLAVSTQTQTADVARWTGCCQDQAVSVDGDEDAGRRGTDALAL